jgi:toxin ParE1/3/4
VRLDWTRLASDDLQLAWEFLAAENPAAAGEQIERIVRVVDGLIHYPELGRKGRVAGTRELVITGTPFVVAYRVRGNDIQVIAVIHGARRWPKDLP